MAYCRFTDADVYVFMSSLGHLECCGCTLQQREWVDDPDWPIFKGYFKSVGETVETNFTSTQGMVDHLALHRAVGHDVPGGLEQELWDDDTANWIEYRRCDLDGCDKRVTCGSPTPAGYVSCCSIDHAQLLGGFADWPQTKDA